MESTTTGSRIMKQTPRALLTNIIFIVVDDLGWKHNNDNHDSHNLNKMANAANSMLQQ